MAKKNTRKPIEQYVHKDKQRVNYPPLSHRRVAVKILDDRGIESLKVMEVG